MNTKHPTMHSQLVSFTLEHEPAMPKAIERLRPVTESHRAGDTGAIAPNAGERNVR